MGGVFGRLSGSNMFITSSSLQGACKLGGFAARLGAAAARKNGIGIGEVG